MIPIYVPPQGLAGLFGPKLKKETEMKQILITQKRKMPIVTLNNLDLRSDDVVFYRAPRIYGAHGTSGQIGILVWDYDDECWGFKYHRSLIKNMTKEMYFCGKSANKAIGNAINNHREVYVTSYNGFINYLGENK